MIIEVIGDLCMVVQCCGALLSYSGDSALTT